MSPRAQPVIIIVIITIAARADLQRVAVVDAHVPDDHPPGALLALLHVEAAVLVAEHVGRVAR